MTRTEPINESPFEWDQVRETAALLVAEGGKEQEIADAVGVHRNTLGAWRKHPQFQKRVAEHLAEFRRAVRAQGISIMENRVKEKQKRYDLLNRVLDARAAAGAAGPDSAVPGMETGLVVKTVKGIGKGDEFVKVSEFRVDVGTLKEMRELETSAARELGQLTEKHEFSGPGGGPIELDARVTVGYPTGAVADIMREFFAYLDAGEVPPTAAEAVALAQGINELEAARAASVAISGNGSGA